jgi:glycosyltransferase involved in cell wall biosynthesis
MLKPDVSNLVKPLGITRYKVIVAIPCYNTQLCIAEVVTSCKKYVDEVLVIDDGSSDLTSNIAQFAGARVIRHPVNKGYGEAIKSGFAEAKSLNADILVTIDGDGQHNPDEIPCLLNQMLKQNAVICIGSRFINNDHNDMPPYRKFGNVLINWLWNLKSKSKISDTQSGFRTYTQHVFKEMTFSEKGMGISIEILEKVRRKNMKVTEFSISCSYKNNNSSFTLKAVRQGLVVVFSILRMRINSQFRK